MSQKWIYKPAPDEEIVDSISSSIGFGTLESKILVLRGIDDYQKAREYLIKMGFDGLRYNGGVNMNAKKHDVFLAYKATSISIKHVEEVK
jgi:hypothetical protein